MLVSRTTARPAILCDPHDQNTVIQNMRLTATVGLNLGQVSIALADAHVIQNISACYIVLVFRCARSRDVSGYKRTGATLRKKIKTQRGFEVVRPQHTVIHGSSCMWAMDRSGVAAVRRRLAVVDLWRILVSVGIRYCALLL